MFNVAGTMGPCELLLPVPSGLFPVMSIPSYCSGHKFVVVLGTPSSGCVLDDVPGMPPSGDSSAGPPNGRGLSEAAETWPSEGDG